MHETDTDLGEESYETDTDLGESQSGAGVVLSCVVPMEEKKVTLFIGSCYFYPSFFLLQSKLDNEREESYKTDTDLDPEIKITLVSAAAIHNCLSLGSLASIGPVNNLPVLNR